jgi:8-oxo-dGTP diphosphatase
MKSFYVGIKGVFVKDEKVLILKRQDSDGVVFWDMPGGRINDDEDIENALHRELKEELGVTGVLIGEVLTAFRLPNYNRDGHGLMILYYRVSSPVFTIKLNDEHIDYKWVSRDELLNMLGVGQIINEGIQMAVSLAAE